MKIIDCDHILSSLQHENQITCIAATSRCPFLNANLRLPQYQLIQYDQYINSNQWNYGERERYTIREMFII